jgi:hypothetical protein
MTKNRFAAKLLFQYRVRRRPSESKLRICEERIVVLAKPTGAAAHAEALKIGKNSEASYSNDEGNPVYIEFVGILDLIDLGPECGPGEVWYEIKTMLTPMERRRALIPKKTELSAFRTRR